MYVRVACNHASLHEHVMLLPDWVIPEYPLPISSCPRITYRDSLCPFTNLKNLSTGIHADRWRGHSWIPLSLRSKSPPPPILVFLLFVYYWSSWVFVHHIQYFPLSLSHSHLLFSCRRQLNGWRRSTCRSRRRSQSSPLTKDSTHAMTTRRRRSTTSMATGSAWTVTRQVRDEVRVWVTTGLVLVLIACRNGVCWE